MGAYLSFNASLEIQGHRFEIGFNRVVTRYTKIIKRSAKQSTIVTINEWEEGGGGRGYFQQLSAVDAQSVNSTLNVERADLARICDTIFASSENPPGVDLKKFACPSKYPSKRWSVDLRGFERMEFFSRMCSHCFYSDTGQRARRGKRENNGASDIIRRRVRNGYNFLKIEVMLVNMKSL